jgi:hypothetical protein
LRTLAARLLVLTALLAVSATATAQDDAWEHDFAIYLLGAGLDGETQLGPVVTQVDQSFSDILESLEIGGMGAYRARKGPWAITFDAVFVALGGNQAGSLGVLTADADIDQLIVGADVGYSLSDRFELLAGARYNSLDLQLQLTAPGGGSTRVDGDEDWIDPYLGARLTMPFGAAWQLVLRADIGGFDVGSETAWNAVARFDWQLSENSSLLFGYRILDVDYETGSGLSLFRYDMTTSGPIAGFAWHF